MQLVDYFKILVEDIHTTVMASIDENNKPITAAIALMDYDESGIYFLTANGKSFYSRISKNPYISLTSVKGENTLSSIAISLHGKVIEIGAEKIEDLLEKNPYMKDIYPNAKSRKVLTAFKIIEGNGDYISLEKGSFNRKNFLFGNVESKELQYIISDICGGCGHCVKACPQNCISEDQIPYIIEQDKCLRCGACAKACPNKGILHEYTEIKNEA